MPRKPKPAEVRPAAPRVGVRGWLAAHPLRAAVLSTVVLSFLTVAVFPPRYETNDDAGMNAIVQGVLFCDRPDEHVCFINVALSLPLTWLYRVAPNLPWYGGGQLALVVVSACAVAYLFLRTAATGKLVAVAGIHFAAVVVPCLTSVQFTKTAYLVAEAGGLLLLGPVLFPGAWPRAGTVVGVALAVLGSLVRFDSFVLAVVQVAAFGVALAAIQRPPVRVVLRVTAAAGVATALAFAAKEGNRRYYEASPGWAGFYEYNALRAAVTDYDAVAYTPESRPAFDALGWDENDFHLMRNWFNLDPERYRVEKLRQLLATAPRQPRPWPAPDIVPREDDHGVLLAAGAACTALIGCRRRWLVPAGMFALGAGLTVWLARDFYLPSRVWFCLFCPVPVAAGLVARGGFAPLTRPVGWAQLAVVVGMTGLVGWAAVERSAKWDRERERRLQLEAALARLEQSPGRLYVAWGEWFPTEVVVRPLGDHSRLRPLKFVGLGWGTRTPITARRLAEFGVTDLAWDAPRRADVLFVCHPDQLELLTAHAFARHGDVLEPPEEALIDRRVPLFVYRLRATPQGPPL